jgi:hypothetical protein
MTHKPGRKFMSYDLDKKDEKLALAGWLTTS